MMDNQYLVARYIPNLERGETLNCGIVLWKKGRIGCRFVEPSKADFACSFENYSRWISYWSGLCQQKSIGLFGKKSVTLRSPKFIEQIQGTGNGNFVLHHGGSVFSEDGIKSFDDQLDFLFTRIVAHKPQRDSSRPPGIVQKCGEFLDRVGLRDEAGFRANCPVSVGDSDFSTELHFDYGIILGNKIRRLFQRVNLNEEESVTSAVGRFQPAQFAQKVNRSVCVALFDSNGADEAPGIRGSVNFLDRFAVPIDVSDPVEAASKYRSMLMQLPSMN